MSISVTCSNGHALKVKDKYAGKMGLCPYCKAQVAVPMLEPAHAEFSDSKILSFVQSGPPHETPPVHEDVLHHESFGGSSMSLASSSFLRKNTKPCPKCKANVLTTYDLCPHCHTYFTDWGEIKRRISTRCKRCGAENRPGALECDECGADLPR